MAAIFVSHPFAGEPEINKTKADIVCKILQKRYPDHLLLSPLHAFAFHKDDAKRDLIMKTCEEWIKHRDTKMLISFGLSRGCLKELGWAFESHTKVKHCRLYNGEIVNIKFVDYHQKRSGLEFNKLKENDFDPSSILVNAFTIGESSAQNRMIKKVCDDISRFLGGVDNG